MFYRPEREAQVLRNVMERNEGPLSDTTMARLFREIMSSCLALEQPLKVAYLGPEGTFSEAAARCLPGVGDALTAYPTVRAAMDAARAGDVDGAVVPLAVATQASAPSISASRFSISTRP